MAAYTENGFRVDIRQLILAEGLIQLSIYADGDFVYRPSVRLPNPRKCVVMVSLSFLLFSYSYVSFSFHVHVSACMVICRAFRYVIQAVRDF